MLVGVEQTYRPRNPEENPLYGVVASHLETYVVTMGDWAKPLDAKTITSTETSVVRMKGLK